MSTPYPLSFTPHHRAPEEHPEPPLCFAFRGRELLVDGSGRLPPVAEIDGHGLDSVRTQYLGRLGDRHCYSAELAADQAPPADWAFRDLRMAYGTLEPEIHAVASRAVQVVDWDRHHQYCGACGTPTELSQRDRSRQCPTCKVPLYPRLSPAMIVCVERDDEILLARSAHFPPGIFSVLAGFVEPGESVEDAVIREVWEETRIVVDDVQYYSSQPWPYPNSLMLGFTARYVEGEIDTGHDEEIEEADWFTVDALPKVFPGRISISQWLLHDWVERRRAGRNG